MSTAPVTDPIDPRIETLRWTSYRGLGHLWLGAVTPCGKRPVNLQHAWSAPYCTTCLAYAQGWLDRHDHSGTPEFGQPDPTGRAVPRRPFADRPAAATPTSGAAL